MDEAWEAICARWKILSHDFSKGPYYLSKQATYHFSKTSQREARYKGETAESISRALACKEERGK